MLTLLTHSFPTAPCSDLRRNKPPAAPAFAGATSYAISASHPQGGPAPSEIDLRPQPEGVRRIIAVARRGRDAGVVDPQLSVVGGQADEVDRPIGKASCRERGWQYVRNSVVAGALKKKKYTGRSPDIRRYN